MSYYTQLTREERYQVYALNAAGQNQTEIAQIIGVTKPPSAENFAVIVAREVIVPSKQMLLPGSAVRRR